MQTEHYHLWARNRQSAMNKFKKGFLGRKVIIVGCRKGVISGKKKHGMYHYEVEYRYKGA